MKLLKITLTLISLFLLNVSDAQSFKNYKFYSDRQTDKSLNGQQVNSKEQVTISIKDPKPLTKASDQFNQLTVGKIILAYATLPPEEIEIKYFGHYKNDKDVDWYGITKTTLDYNTVFIMKSKNLINNNIYNYKIVLANMNENSGSLTTYTAYFCKKLF